MLAGKDKHLPVRLLTPENELSRDERKNRLLPLIFRIWPRTIYVIRKPVENRNFNILETLFYVNKEESFKCLYSFHILLSTYPTRQDLFLLDKADIWFGHLNHYTPFHCHTFFQITPANHKLCSFLLSQILLENLITLLEISVLLLLDLFSKSSALLFFLLSC